MCVLSLLIATKMSWLLGLQLIEQENIDVFQLSPSQPIGKKVMPTPPQIVWHIHDIQHWTNEFGSNSSYELTVLGRGTPDTTLANTGITVRSRVNK